MFRIVRCVVVAGVFAAAGCAVRPVPVSGVVTFDGKPLAGAVVTFLPTDTESPIGASSAVTDEAGRYALTTVHPPASGVGPGPHKVSISKRTKVAPARPAPRGGTKDEPAAVMVAEDSERESLPDRYNMKTDLTFDVPSGGSDQANFALTK